MKKHRLELRWQGRQRTGDVPDFALRPRGGLCPTPIFYRRLG